MIRNNKCIIPFFIRCFKSLKKNNKLLDKKKKIVYNDINIIIETIM